MRLVNLNGFFLQTNQVDYSHTSKVELAKNYKHSHVWQSLNSQIIKYVHSSFRLDEINPNSFTLNLSMRSLRDTKTVPMQNKLKSLIAP
jgi:hypothetical protein